MDQEKEIQMYEEWLMTDEFERYAKAMNQVYRQAE
ncbi:hypothetical protein JOD01_002460 [Brevibacillus fulvus]|uniref:Uncharacterized protein n=1 Tax=Brevibacillus fulvus TaxID=1125967 RepID=A0A938Y0B4_9BACL|nr:hypothetical protein [Brevibacillus fulvus]